MTFTEKVLKDADGNAISPTTLTETVQNASGTGLNETLSSLMVSINTVSNKTNAADQRSQSNTNKINLQEQTIAGHTASINGIMQNMGNLKFWSGTEAQYQALPTKDSKTIYFTTKG